MRWTPGNRGNVEDARGSSGGVGIPLGIGGVVILLIGSWLTGVNLFDVVGGGGAATDVVAERPATTSPEEEQLVDFVDAVTGDIQHTWSQKIANYQPTRHACCSATAFNRLAGCRAPRPVRFTVPAIARSTWT